MLIGTLTPFLISGQNHDSAELYCVSSAVEEKLEMTLYYPTAFAFIGQFWDTSHSYFNFRTRQGVWVEPEKKSGFGFVSAEISIKNILGIKKSPIYLSTQVRFNSHTSIWAGANIFFSDNRKINKYFYQLQLGAYSNTYEKEFLFSGYYQTRPFLKIKDHKRVFLEGFANYYAESREYNYEFEAGFKMTHSLSIMCGVERFEGSVHVLGGIRFEMYEHKNYH